METFTLAIQMEQQIGLSSQYNLSPNVQSWSAYLCVYLKKYEMRIRTTESRCRKTAKLYPITGATPTGIAVNLTRHAVGLFRKGDIPILAPTTAPKEFSLPPDTPCRESVHTVRPGDVAKRGQGGSIANRTKLLHALANIESWAIDLAWDIITRFARGK
ncbi:hypothetical protein VP01_10659g1, partial [Puccinia sorghi]